MDDIIQSTAGRIIDNPQQIEDAAFGINIVLVIVIVGVFVADKVMSMIHKYKYSGAEGSQEVREIIKKVDSMQGKMHDIHSLIIKTDVNGMPFVYRSIGQDKLIEELIKEMKANTETVRSSMEVHKTTHSKQNDIIELMAENNKMYRERNN